MTLLQSKVWKWNVQIQKLNFFSNLEDDQSASWRTSQKKLIPSEENKENQAKLAHQVTLPWGHPYGDQKTHPLPRQFTLVSQVGANLIWLNQYLGGHRTIKQQYGTVTPGDTLPRSEGGLTNTPAPSLRTWVWWLNDCFSRPSSSADSKFASLILFSTTTFSVRVYCHRLNCISVLLSRICDVKHLSNRDPPNYEKTNLFPYFQVLKQYFSQPHAAVTVVETTK